MGLWKLLGGEVNHKAITKLNWEAEQDFICSFVSIVYRYGIEEALNPKEKWNNKYSKEEAMKLLKYIGKKPLEDWEFAGKIQLKFYSKIPSFKKWNNYGKEYKNNWKKAHQWLYEQEHPKLSEKETKNQRNIDELIKWNKDLQEENHILREKIKKYEKNK